MELVIDLAKKFDNFNFHLYGDTLSKKFEVTKNLKIHGHINYNTVPKSLVNSDILLLPSAKIQYGRSKNINISNYNSPLKMFDYLAAGRVIISSKRSGILEILKHNQNSIIVNGFKVSDWEKTIYKIISNKYNLNKIRIKSIETAKQNLIEERMNHIETVGSELGYAVRKQRIGKKIKYVLVRQP